VCVCARSSIAGNNFLNYKSSLCVCYFCLFVRVALCVCVRARVFVNLRV
jgi:hypothetical protein